MSHTMRSLLLAAATLPMMAPVAAQDRDPWAQHRSLKVLYAGSPEGSREEAFKAFLERWFDTVGTIHLAELSMKTAAPYDVVIADWMSQYGNDGYPEPKGLHRAPGRIGPEFTRPVVAMTYVGTQIRRGYKLDWL